VRAPWAGPYRRFRPLQGHHFQFHATVAHLGSGWPPTCGQCWFVMSWHRDRRARQRSPSSLALRQAASSLAKIAEWLDRNRKFACISRPSSGALLEACQLPSRFEFAVSLRSKRRQQTSAWECPPPWLEASAR